ncbi:MAG TPA: hypothetical protein VF791_11485 [Pyrinomonadaceae bacterium]
MITRIWHGWTTHENALDYQELVEEEILPSIANRWIRGYRGAHLIRRDHENEVEFITLLWFDTPQAVREFAGENQDAAVVPAKARALLSRYDELAAHYQVIIEPE